MFDSKLSPVLAPRYTLVLVITLVSGKGGIFSFQGSMIANGHLLKGCVH